MPCPAESRTLDEFENKTPTYESGKPSSIREYLSKAGVRILKAVKLYPERKGENSGAGKEGDEYKTRMKLETLLGQTAGKGELVDSAWGCDCDPECDCNRECGCESFHYHECRHCHCVGDCSCVKDCGCHKDCDCENASWRGCCHGVDA